MDRQSAVFLLGLSATAAGLGLASPADEVVTTVATGGAATPLAPVQAAATGVGGMALAAFGVVLMTVVAPRLESR